MYGMVGDPSVVIQNFCPASYLSAVPEMMDTAYKTPHRTYRRILHLTFVVGQPIFPNPNLCVVLFFDWLGFANSMAVAFRI